MITFYTAPNEVYPDIDTGAFAMLIRQGEATVRWIKYLLPQNATFVGFNNMPSVYNPVYDPVEHSFTLSGFEATDNINPDIYFILHPDADGSSGEWRCFYSENADGSNAIEAPYSPDVGNDRIFHVESPVTGIMEVTSPAKPYLIDTTREFAFKVTNTGFTPIQYVNLSIPGMTVNSATLPDGWRNTNPDPSTNNDGYFEMVTDEKSNGIQAGQSKIFKLNVTSTFLPGYQTWQLLIMSRLTSQYGIQTMQQVGVEFHVHKAGDASGIGQIPGGGGAGTPPPLSAKPDAEEIVLQWLLTFINDQPVAGDKPKDNPDRFILVDRTRGGREAMVLDRAEILIEVYDRDSRVNAKNLAGYIADRIPDLLGYAEDVTRASVNSVVNLDDLIGEMHRYQIYFDLYHRR